MMRTLTAAGFAACVALAFPAQALVFSKTYTSTVGTAVTANLSFTTEDVLNARGGYTVTNMTGNVGSDLITGFLANPSAPSSRVSPDGAWNYDGVYYDAPRILDSDGVVFTTASGLEYNFWGDSATSYSLHSKRSDGAGNLSSGPNSSGYVGDTPPPPPPPAPTVLHPSSSPTLITFEELSPSASENPAFSINGVTSQGYLFKQPNDGCCTYVGTMPDSPTNGERFVEWHPDQGSQMKALDGASFSVASLQGSLREAFLAPTTIQLTGLRKDGSSVTQSITLDGSAFQTYNLSGFTKLASLTFGTASGSGVVAIDNILAQAVPEPASWAMMLAGFGLTGAAMRRRKAAIVFA